MRRRSQRGFSIIEVLASLTLFMIVAGAVTAFSRSSLRSSVTNRHASNAAFIAQEQIETLRGLDYPSIVSSTTSVSIAGQNYTLGTVVVNNSPAAGMKDITVTVRWTGPEGPRSYAIRTIYTSLTT